MEYLEIINITNTFPPYRNSTLLLAENILGGLMFGIGMTLASGCGNKTLLRFGGGNIKSIFVLLIMGVAAYLMIFTDFGFTYFLSWMEPANIDLTEKGIEHQGLGAIVGGLLESDTKNTGFIISAVLGGLFILWALLSSDFFKSFDNVLAGFVVGLVVIAAWWVSTGEMGQLLLEEAEMMDERPYGLGAQSFTFVQPSGHFIMWLKSGLSSNYVTFALIAAAGVISGSLLYSILFRKFKIEWFNGWKDFVTHVIGAVLMGIGGVLAIGCTIGQAVTGVSTLALGSFITFAAIVFGSALTMKIQYYQMVYEDEASFIKALVASLADMRLLPNGLRKLDKV
jgi:uncharacterized membrane protein YedE/YeeE